jgi:hypothetical protein
MHLSLRIGVAVWIQVKVKKFPVWLVREEEPLLVPNGDIMIIVVSGDHSYSLTN